MARLKRLLPFLAVALIAVIVFALFEMGVWPFGGSSGESVAATADHAAATHSTTTSSIAATGTAQYAADLTAWRAKYWNNADTGAFTFKNATAPTAKEVQRAQALADQQTESVAALKLIKPAAAIAQAHSLYVAAIDGEAKAVQRMVRAIRNKNWRDVELAMRDMNTARAVEVKTVAALDAYLGQSDQLSSTPILTPASTPGSAPTSTPTSTPGSTATSTPTSTPSSTATSTPTSTPTVQWATFSSSKLGFSVQYPKDWDQLPLATLMDQPPIGVAFAVADPAGTEIATHPGDYMAVAAGPYDAKNDGTPSAIVEGSVKDMQTSSAGQFAIVKAVRAFKLDGLDAADCTASITLQGETLMFRNVCVVSGKVGFVFQFCGEKNRWPDESAIFQAVLDSLKVGAAT
jgi:hypothetical protein